MFRKRVFIEPESMPLPRPTQPTHSPQSFFLCPVFAGLTPAQLLCQQWLYQKAFEEAQAVARPSLPERDLLAVWN